MIPSQSQILRDLGGGLVMRRSTADDAERLAQFNARIHGENPDEAERIAGWTRDLLLTRHPTFHTDDFIVVENTADGAVVSTLNLIDQTWAYAGIPFGVGRPELVGTDPAYRGRGLVRAMFEVVHEWSRQRGQMVQVITGIPNFYRQYGYEMGLALGGGRGGYEVHVPKLKEGEAEPYRVREAGEADLPFLMGIYERERRRSLVSSVIDETQWRYELSGRSDRSIERKIACVIEDAAGAPVGYLTRPDFLWGDRMAITRYELAENVSFGAVTPSVIRYIWSVGLELAQAQEKKLLGYLFDLGADHPVYHTGILPIPSNAPDLHAPTYAFYVRVPDLPAFLMKIAPAIESNLRDSVVAGHTGELKVSFYQSGVKFNFEQGRLASVESWKPKVKDDEGTVSFPGLTFLMLVFGHRSIPEIRHIFADCWANSDAEVLLTAMFPKKTSHVWVIS